MVKNSGKNEIARRVISFARSLGFAVEETNNGHLKFTREGALTVFFSGTPGDQRAYQNGVAKLRRADRGAA